MPVTGCGLRGISPLITGGFSLYWRRTWKAWCEPIEVVCRGFSCKPLCKVYELLGISRATKRKAIKSAMEGFQMALNQGEWSVGQCCWNTSQDLINPGWLGWVRLHDVERPQTFNTEYVCIMGCIFDSGFAMLLLLMHLSAPAQERSTKTSGLNVMSTASTLYDIGFNLSTHKHFSNLLTNVYCEYKVISSKLQCIKFVSNSWHFSWQVSARHGKLLLFNFIWNQGACKWAMWAWKLWKTMQQ